MKLTKSTFILSFFFFSFFVLLMLWIVPELLILRFFHELSIEIKQGELEKLFQGLRHPKKKVVKNTVDLIDICVPNEKNLDRVLQHLTESHPIVRLASIRLLGKYGKNGSRGVPLLIQDFETRERVEQYFILQALEQIGSGAALAVPVLIDVLEDTDVNFRKKSAEILIAIGASAGRALPRLVLSEEVFDTDQSVFDKALESVGPATAESLPEFLLLLKDSSKTKIIQKVLRQLVRMGPEGKLLLNEVLAYSKNASIPIRCLALEAIASFGVRTQEVQEVVLSQIQAHEGDVRKQACLTLQKIGSSRMIPALEALCKKDPDLRFRESLKTTIEILREQRDPE